MLKLKCGMKIKLNNGRHIHYGYMSAFGDPIFRLDGIKTKITIIDDQLYSVSDVDYDEPRFPLREDFQATEFFKKYTYDFYVSALLEKD